MRPTCLAYYLLRNLASCTACWVTFLHAPCDKLAGQLDLSCGTLLICKHVVGGHKNTDAL